MQTVNVRNSGGIILLGRQGENLARSIRFDLSRWQALYGEGRAELIHQRPGEDTIYPVTVSQDGPWAVWAITDTDTALPGVGHCELRYYVDETIAKSEIWRSRVSQAMDGDILQPPAPGQSWLDQVIQARTAAAEAAEKAEKAAVRQPIVGSNGTWWTWNLDTGTYTDSGTEAKGPQGKTGPQGEAGPAGYTPVRGTDYWTADDQQAMIDAVLAALPAAEGVSV